MTDLMKAAETVARALDRLGNADAATPMGAIEGMASHVRDGLDGIASSMLAVADALDRVADAIREKGDE